MSREIKFRVWDWKCRRMEDVDQIDIYPNGRKKVYFGPWADTHSVLIPKNGSLMQFTGLKDKDGVEIYEGDVIDHHETLDDLRRKPDRVEVWWDSMYSGWSPFCVYDADCGIYVLMKSVKIVGNIYENPELLA